MTTHNITSRTTVRHRTPSIYTSKYPSVLVSCTVLLLIQVVFGEEDKALQVLTPLIGVIPEALLNAVIVHLRQGKHYVLFA